MRSDRILHIFNGEEALEKYRENKFKDNSIYIPFNDTICYGEHSPMIFKGSFIHARSKSLNVLDNYYITKVIDPLLTLFNETFELIVLHFNDDMCSMINLLTILAYVDYWGFKGQVVRVKEDNKNEIIDFKGYHKIYVDVIMNKMDNENVDHCYMKNAITWYLNNYKDINLLGKYIVTNIDKENDVLYKDIEKSFPKLKLDKELVQIIIQGIKNISG